jgi:ubiquinone/menaquinone biosynthesis C-methylase UbiE
LTAGTHPPSLWDGIAARYDGLRPDQGLTDPAVRAAWRTLVESHLPDPPSAVLDVGCGTGSISLMLAEASYTVTGIDYAPGMIEVARAKATAANTSVAFDVQDGSSPDFPPASFDAIVCRQTLWALPDRRAALSNWATLLRPGGRLILVEGRFASGNGMSADQIEAAFPPAFSAPIITDLGINHALWGGPIPDQRLLVTAARQ